MALAMARLLPDALPHQFTELISVTRQQRPQREDRFTPHAENKGVLSTA